MTNNFNSFSESELSNVVDCVIPDVSPSRSNGMSNHIYSRARRTAIASNAHSVFCHGHPRAMKPTCTVQIGKALTDELRSTEGRVNVVARGRIFPSIRRIPVLLGCTEQPTPSYNTALPSGSIGVPVNATPTCRQQVEFLAQGPSGIEHQVLCGFKQISPRLRHRECVMQVATRMPHIWHHTGRNEKRIKMKLIMA